MPRVVVFGSSNTDMTVRLPHLPARGQTVLGRSFLTTPGGKGANQAVAARRAGADVVFVTAVGDDALGREAIGRYRGLGIDVEHTRIVPAMASGVALIFVDDDGENMIGVASGANLALVPDDIDRLPDALFCAGDVLLACLEIPLETAVRALERGDQSGMRTILNPAPAPVLDEPDTRRLLAHAAVITPNRVEAMAMARRARDAGTGRDVADAVRRLVELGARDVVVTLGADGCLVAPAGDEPQPIPAPRVEAVDTVGAGDAFNGALAVALAEGRSLRDAARWAASAAALAVTQPGAQAALPSREAIDQLAAGDLIPG